MTKKAEKHVKLDVKVKGKYVYVDQGGLRFSNTKVMPVPDFFGKIIGSDKGLRRAVRKQLEAVGRHDLASMSVHCW